MLSSNLSCNCVISQDPSLFLFRQLSDKVFRTNEEGCGSIHVSLMTPENTCIGQPPMQTLFPPDWESDAHEDGC